MVFLTEHILQGIYKKIQLGVKLPQENVEVSKINEQ